MKVLTPTERRALRARAHALNPIVMIGSAGLTEAVLKEIDLALKNHELIKIRMLGADRDGRDDALERVCAALDASPVQLIGKILVVFRPRPEPERQDTETPRTAKRASGAPRAVRASTGRKAQQSREGHRFPPKKRRWTKQ